MLQSMSSQRVGVVQPLNKEQIQFNVYFPSSLLWAETSFCFVLFFSVPVSLKAFISLSSRDSEKSTATCKYPKFHLRSVDSFDYFIFTGIKWKIKCQNAHFKPLYPLSDSGFFVCLFVCFLFLTMEDYSKIYYVEIIIQLGSYIAG